VSRASILGKHREPTPRRLMATGLLESAEQTLHAAGLDDSVVPPAAMAGVGN